MALTEASAISLRRGVPLDEYLRWREWSQSAIKLVARSPKHAMATHRQERDTEPTDAMLLGSALHCAFLEPDAAPDRVVEWTGKVRRGREWDAFRTENAEKIILTQGRYASLRAMLASLRAHPVVRAWSPRIEAVEVCATGVLCGVPIKGRCDALTCDPLIDLKMTRDGSLRGATRTAINFAYHVQAAMYCRLFQRERFVLLFVEDAPPYDCAAYELDEQAIRQGERLLEQYCLRIAECTMTDRWPGYGNEIQTLSLPDWALDETVDFSGIGDGNGEG